MYLPHLAYFLVPLAVAYLMMRAGVEKKALEWKRSRRICPSCDRESHRCSCRR